MSTSSGSIVALTFTLAPLFAFIMSIFSRSNQVEQNKPKPKQQPNKILLLDESRQNTTYINSKTSAIYPTSSKSVRTFIFALLRYIDTISDGPANNISCDRIELLWRMKNALSNHEDVLHQLTALYYGEQDDEEKRRLLFESVERGTKTNAIIVKFIYDCCHDGHPRGLLKYRIKTAFFSDQLERATDEQQSFIYAYKVAKGDMLLS